jgi:SAM-dependent methyltransferase
MRSRAGTGVLAAAPLAAVLAAVAAGVAGGSFVVAVLVGLAVLLVAGLQVLVIVHLRRLRRRLDQVARGLGVAPKASFATQAAKSRDRAAQATEDAAATVWVGALPVPPVHLRFMGESDERFVATARTLAAVLGHSGLQPGSDVLDVGCGYGRLAVGLLDDRSFTGTYLGFDILPRHVAWCANVITAADQRFAFRHLDLLNQRYNPTGTLDPSEATFPADDSSVDVCALFSVFTHLYRPTVERYLGEIARVLRPDGTAATSWLLFDDERLADVVADSSHYPLRLVGVDGSRYMEADDPLRAIGFPEQDVVAMAGKAGLSVDRIERGYWATGVPESDASQFQDLVVLRRASGTG